MGRPTKVEGQPGASGEPGRHRRRSRQASVLDLYDPDRSQTLTFLGEIRPWGSFLAAMRRPLDGRAPRREPACAS